MALNLDFMRILCQKQEIKVISNAKLIVVKLKITKN